jgi:membrane AbrB-like protein
MTNWRHAGRCLLTAAVATIGGVLALLLHIPLPWMIGAMLGSAALAWHEHAAVPQPVRPVALVVLGLGLGQSFTGPVLQAVLGALPLLVMAGVIAILSGVAVARIFTFLAGTDGRNGYFCAVPGGIATMAVLAQRAGVSVPTVVLAQTMRMVVVVLLFPPLMALIAPHGADGGAFSAAQPTVATGGLALLLLIGAAAGGVAHVLKLANPWMLAPCLVCIPLAASGHLPSGVPVALVDAAQVGMGAALGVRLTKRFLLGSRRLAAASVASGFLLSALLAVLAVPVALLGDLPVPAAVLGMAPGGMPEMAITAKALDLAVPLVLGFHLVRTLLCSLLVGPIWRAAVALGLAR